MSHAERPVVVEYVEFVPVFEVNLQGLLFVSVSPTLTLRPIPYAETISLSVNNTVLTIVSEGRVIVKLLYLVELFDVTKRYPAQYYQKFVSPRVMTLSVAQLVYEFPLISE